MARCRDSTASSFVAKVRDEVFSHFHAVAVKVTVVCRINCFGSQVEFFVNNPFVVDFGLGGFGFSVYDSRFLPRTLV
jgi:hypothetical protein